MCYQVLSPHPISTPQHNHVKPQTGLAGVKRVEPPSHAEQAGVPWFQSMHNVLRAFQTTKVNECVLYV